MKTDKNGNIKLTGADYRVGNFIYSSYRDTIEVMDINSRFRLKLSREVQLCQIIAMGIEQKADGYLHTLAAVLFRFNTAVPDPEFYKDVLDAADRLAGRHKALYGAPEKEPDDKEDAKIIREERDLQQFVDEVRKMDNGESPSPVSQRERTER